jgi:hypothetical protein
MGEMGELFQRIGKTSILGSPEHTLKFTSFSGTMLENPFEHIMLGK